jgi:hypothetical protein
MSTPHCANCSLRARYDRNPRSIIGRLWRWHINFCPGWKSYVKSLPAEERCRLQERYSLAGSLPEAKG